MINDELFISLISKLCNISPIHHPISPNLRKEGLQYNEPVKIGNNVCIGSAAQILPGIEIGENTVIGAGSVVTKNIPANVVAIGTPCKVIRKIVEE